MDNGNEVIDKFLRRRAFLVIQGNEFRLMVLAEPLEIIVAEANESVFASLVLSSPM